MKSVIGRREWFTILEFELDWVRAKIDTGSGYSFLHGIGVQSFQKNGERWVKFLSIDGAACESPVIFVENSEEEIPMYFIEISVETLDRQVLEILVGLKDRSFSKYQLSLGRRALTGFLVDSCQSYVFGKM